MKIDNSILFEGLYKDKKVLITGDTGFKGSWLAIWLKLLGAEVYGYSLSPKTENDNFVKTNLNKIIKHKDGDVRNLEKLQKYFTNVQPDIAFHLAAQPIVLESYKQPHYTFETNLMGVVNFFEAVRNTPSVKAAVNVTSDKCYQNNEWIWGYRETDSMGGNDPYSASKGCSELITNSYINSFFSNNSECSIASVRAGNVIGGGDWAVDRIIPDFFRTVKKKEKLIIRNPNAIRPWQFVLEPLSGYLLLASKLLVEGKKFSGGWNFGPTDISCHSVNELINSIISFLGYGEVTFEETKEKLHEANTLKLDISKAGTLLKWKPVLTYDELISFTANGYKADFETVNLYKKRVEQIVEYCSYAVQRDCHWIAKVV